MRVALLSLAVASAVSAAEPFDTHGPVLVSKSGTHLAHRDGTPFFFLADTCWTGPALSTADDWQTYLADRKKKGFTAVQFNMVSPWRTAPTDADGNTSYTLAAGKLTPNEAFYRRLDDRMNAIVEAGLLPVPVLCWAHKAGDAGKELTEKQLVTLITFELDRYKKLPALWVLAGDNNYQPADTEKWKRIGRAVFADRPGLAVTTHPTGMNFPWAGWENEAWLTVLGYQSGHGDDANTRKWIHSGPPTQYAKTMKTPRPLINLEPPYEDHNGYQSKKPHSAESVRMAVYWSLLNAPVAGVTYGGHGVWSWHTKPGEPPTDHPGTGVAKPWREALDLPGAAQVGHARKLFESLPWTDLRPAQHLLAEQPGADDANKFVAVSATPDRSVIVAYAPAGGLKLKPLPAGREAKFEWFDPRTGVTTPAGDAKFTPPGPGDYVLVVRQ